MIFLETNSTSELEALKNLIQERALQVMLLCFISMASCQFIKFVVMSIVHKKFEINLLFSTGGMPSSHTSTVTTLVTSLALFQLTEGECSLDYSFAVAFVFACIVIHDAMGVRLEASKHAVILNRLVEQEPIEVKKELGYGKKGQLKELLGHKQTEVLVGLLYGVVIAIIGYFIIKGI